MSIKEIRELLTTVGERRRQLGLSTLQSQPGDWGSRLTEPKSSDDEPKPLEDG